jgi:hypothetical protein
MLIYSGYQRFPEHLSKHKNIRVLTNHVVKEITYQSGNQTNYIKCENGKNF